MPGAKTLTVQAMLTYSLHTNSALHPRFDSRVGFDRDVAFVPQSALRSRDRHSRSGEDSEQPRHFRPGPFADLRTSDITDQAVRIFPSDAVTRRRLAWDGMAIEVVQALGHEKVEISFRASVHLLVAYEEGVRGNGETLIESLPRSTLRDVKCKLAFVPAGHNFPERQRTPLPTLAYAFFLPPSTTSAYARGAPTAHRF